ncbi:peptidogalycan biosysnthesis protein, partial [Salmonella enterica subsp. enterica serovar Minnesota]|uniref:peptidogalycan biosysnthesis protein n=1 Tax=Salmonella enterica TaxID=28901 RepID=UPI003D2E8EA3
GLSSVHFTFLPEGEAQLLGGQGFLLRNDRQFHFSNRNYRDFEDFLEALSSRKRKVVRRERREAVAGLTIEQLSGADLTEEAWDAFFQF